MAQTIHTKNIVPKWEELKAMLFIASYPKTNKRATLMNLAICENWTAFSGVGILYWLVLNTNLGKTVWMTPLHKEHSRLVMPGS